MNFQNLARTAYTVERFLNALRLDDGSERTELEENLVRWLSADTRGKGDHLIYQRGTILCYSNARVLKRFTVPQAQQSQTLWCNSNKLSAIDASAFNQNARLVMLGTGGLTLSMSSDINTANARNKNNNNNNNNNNNG